MIYVSSDWHGTSLDKVQALLKKAEFGPNDFLFVLGDVIDRGEHGIDLLKFIMYESNIQLIRGNHEQMLLSCSFLFDEINEESVNELSMQKMKSLTLWQSNGGAATIDGLSKLPHSMRMGIVDFLEDTPFFDFVTVGDKKYLLVHAGINNYGFDASSEHDFLWTRPSLDTVYSSDFITVLGHTPTWFYGEEYKGKILNNGTWINVDVGAAGVIYPALLRLDDMKEFYLE